MAAECADHSATWAGCLLTSKNSKICINCRIFRSRKMLDIREGKPSPNAPPHTHTPLIACRIYRGVRCDSWDVHQMACHSRRSVFCGVERWGNVSRQMSETVRLLGIAPQTLNPPPPLLCPVASDILRYRIGLSSEFSDDILRRKRFVFLAYFSIATNRNTVYTV